MMKMPQLSNDVNRRFPILLSCHYLKPIFRKYGFSTEFLSAIKPIPQSIKRTIDKYGKKQKKKPKKLKRNHLWKGLE